MEIQNSKMVRPRYLTEEELERIVNESDNTDENFSDVSDLDSTSEVNDDELYDLGSDDEADSDHEDETITDEGLDAPDVAIDPAFVSKDGTIWNAQPIMNLVTRLPTENVISLTPGTTRYAKTRVTDPRNAFLLFFPPPIENMILKHSNAYAKQRHGDSYQEIDSN